MSDTMCAAFQRAAADYPDRIALRTLGGEVELTWREYAERVERLAAGLAGLGLERGERIALMLTNRVEFHLVDTAAMQLGAIPFSIYNSYPAEEIEELLRDAGSRILVTEAAFMPEVSKARESDPGLLDEVIVVDDDGAMSLEDLEARAAADFDFDASWRAVQPDDLLTLIYTAGTTGRPNGVQVSHGNMLWSASTVGRVAGLPDHANAISYLPMAHIAERTATHYLPMLHGFTTTLCPDPREVFPYLTDVRPDWFFAPPRMWEKLKAALEAGIAGEQDEEKRRAGRRALDVALRRIRAEQDGGEVDGELLAEYSRADELVLSRFRAMIGFDNVKLAMIGAAPVPTEVIEFFNAIGIPLAEAWGLSEAGGFGTLNPPARMKFGTTGPPVPGVELTLADDGEILLRSPGIMSGYWNRPEKTAEALDDDGWLHTGDIGEQDADGYVRIVDRKKELIINSAGKTMSPVNIEAKLKSSSPLIGQACVIGDRRPYNVALLTLDPDAASAVAAADVPVEIGRAVEAANARLARVEQIKKFELLSVDWEPSGDELTPTMKLKRKAIAAKYAQEIECLYDAG